MVYEWGNQFYRLTVSRWFTASILVIIAATGFLMSHGYLLSGAQSQPLLGWRSAQYFVNYADFGFIKRGFIGSLFYYVPDDNKLLVALVLNCFVILALIGIAIKTLDSCRALIEKRDFLCLYALIILSPLTFANFGYDLGRYDQLNLLLLTFSLWLIKYEKVFLLSFVTLCAMLIHEAYFFYAVPILIAYVIRQENNRREKAPNSTASVYRCVIATGPITASVIASLVLLFFFGRYEPGLSDFSFKLDSFGFDPGPFVVWTRPVSSNISHVYWAWTDGTYSIFDITVFATVFISIFNVLFLSYRANSRSIDCLLLAPFAMLPLYLIGTDYARWLSLTWVMAIIVLVINIGERRFDRLHLNSKHSMLCTALLVAPVGPIGVMQALPLLRVLPF